MTRLLSLLACALMGTTQLAAADRLFVEAEAFRNQGGWSLDTQFIENMGSPYLLAHGLGQPVKDATTQAELPAPGRYRVWVRTKDWVAVWKAPGAPGRFQVLVNGTPLAETFGTKGVTIAFLTDEEKEIRTRKFNDKGIMKEVQERFEMQVKELTNLKEQLNQSQYMNQ